ncbi:MULTISPECIES: hypothetical protein [unclassified Nocardioides]|uniref:hypothetical protein n=1 Tax=unclassified Nocardioides TaxID=2615069 RepID=UPI000702B641|nr:MULTISPECIES: hypothetical protein [unclassified Nocardioides]KRC49042.1 hypothetical protein ASE19_19335 [Nocardioides sp. Root79]KRC75443.1 hypothetical protein ASE20_21240 [Nocardioides sp. Root240]
MTRSRGWGLPLVVLLLAVAGGAAYLLVGPDDSDDPFASYCDAVVDHREDIGAARSAGAETGLLRALPAFEELADEAPEDIRDEWRIVVDRVSDLRDALDDAGVDPASYDPEKPPEGLSADQRKAIRTAAVRLGAEDTAAALSGVEQQARDVCKTPLSL